MIHPSDRQTEGTAIAYSTLSICYMLSKTKKRSRFVHVNLSLISPRYSTTATLQCRVVDTPCGEVVYVGKNTTKKMETTRRNIGQAWWCDDEWLKQSEEMPTVSVRAMLSMSAWFIVDSISGYVVANVADGKDVGLTALQQALVARVSPFPCTGQHQTHHSTVWRQLSL